MSHQGLPGWFPECQICGMGNLDGFVCLTPLADEAHGLTIVERVEADDLVEKDGHWRKRCQLCDHAANADPRAWGSRGYCIDCWNEAVRRGVFPPRYRHDPERSSYPG